MIERIKARIRTHLAGADFGLPPNVLARRLGIKRSDLDPVLSAMNDEVSWSRLGRGGPRWYKLRPTPGGAP